MFHLHGQSRTQLAVNSPHLGPFHMSLVNGPGSVSEISVSVFATVISVTGMKIFRLTGMRLFYTKQFRSHNIATKMAQSLSGIMSTFGVYEVALIVKLQESTKLQQPQTTPCWSLPCEQTTKFVPVIQPAPWPGSYEEALSLQFTLYCWVRVSYPVRNA